MNGVQQGKSYLSGVSLYRKNNTNIKKGMKKYQWAV